MPSSTYTLFRAAMLAKQQVICSYGGCRRELCPVVLGRNKSGEEAALAWQFAGEVGEGTLPPGGTWKCLRIANVRNARSRAGPWHEGSAHGRAQTCVTDVDLDINIEVRKLHRP